MKKSMIPPASGMTGMSVGGVKAPTVKKGTTVRVPSATRGAADRVKKK